MLLLGVALERVWFIFANVWKRRGQGKEAEPVWHLPEDRDLIVSLHKVDPSL